MIPLSKSAQLVDRLNAELNSATSDAFTLKRLEREIEPLLRARDSEERTAGLHLMAMLHALRFEDKDARQLFEQSLAASGYIADYYANYSSLMGSLGFVREAHQLAEKAAGRAPGDAGILSIALVRASDAMRTDKVLEYIDRLSKLEAKDKDKNTERVLECLNWQRLLLENEGIDRDIFLDRYEAARAVARRNRLRVAGEHVRQHYDGVLIEWEAQAEIQKVEAMNAEVIDALAKFPYDRMDLIVSFGYFVHEDAIV